MTGWLAVVPLTAALLSAVLVRLGPWARARPWIAAATALAVGAWATLSVAPLAIPGFLVLAVIWGGAAAVDVADHRLPDSLTLGAIPAFFLVQVPYAMTQDGWAAWRQALIGALVTGAILFILAFINPGGFGLGDVKLGLSTGAALGWLGVGTALLGVAAAFVLTALASLPLMAAHRIGRQSEVPFGPFMLLGVLVAPWASGLLGW